MIQSRPIQQLADAVQPSCLLCTASCGPTTTGRSFAVARRGNRIGHSTNSVEYRDGREHPVEDTDRGTRPFLPDCVGRSRVRHDGRECRRKPNPRSAPVGWEGPASRPKTPALWSWQLHAYDLATGQQVWKQEAATGQPLRKRHLKATHANCTPATNGEYVVAFFGAEGLYCFDHERATSSGRLVLAACMRDPTTASEYEWGFVQFADHS